VEHEAAQAHVKGLIGEIQRFDQAHAVVTWVGGRSGFPARDCNHLRRRIVSEK
jgi:hypothetical protein